MVKEIELEGKGWARGRNGYFVPRRVDCFKDVEVSAPLEKCDGGRSKSVTPPAFHEALRFMVVG
jgi:hypothetical protein